MSRTPVSPASPRPTLLLALAVLVAGSMARAQEPADAPKDEPAAKKKAARPRREKKQEPQRWEEMDYGRFLSATIKAPEPKDNNAMKGIAIKLGSGDGPTAAICFDTDLLRVSAGWTGGFVKLRGTPYDGSHGTWPEVDGKQAFGTKVGPGWARGDDWKDPRPEPYGPLPADWAKYKGLYVNGDHVVLSYTVGETSVMESPWIEGTEAAPIFTRTFNVGPTAKPLTMVIADVEGATPALPGTDNANGNRIEADGIVLKYSPGTPGGSMALKKGDRLTVASVAGAPAGTILNASNSRITLTIPASDKVTSFRLAIGTGSEEDGKALAKFVAEDKAPLDLTAHLKGGPARWAENVETKGVLGTGDGAYVVDTITAPDENPYKSWIRFGGLDFFADGTRAALPTWSGDVWTVSGVDDKLEKLTWQRIATGLFQPLGLKIVDDQVYVLGREGITRLVDLNGDGEADFYEAFNHDMAVTPSFHEFAFDLQTDPEGNFYFAKAGPVRGGGRGFDYIAANSGTVMKVYKDGKTMVTYATGLRAPNGIGVGPEGQVTSGDNEGTWMPKSRLNMIKPGGFYGVVDTAHRDEKPTMYDEPICWFPKDVDNSGGGQAWVTSDRWGPFQGRLLHTSYGTCSLFLALVDQFGDHIQGGVARFPVNFLTGIMRPKFNPRDGQLYVAGLRGWQTSAAMDAAFQRVRYTGKPANMVTGLKVTKTGLDLSFTDPLEPEDANDPDSYQIEQWNYLWCSEYGSDDYSAKTPDFQAKVMELNRLREDREKNAAAIEELTKQLAKGRDEVTVKSAKLSEDGKTVSLEIEDLKPVMQMHIQGRLKSADGKRVPVDVYNTINAIP
ncbi:DUF6797 domain-containing protein [Tundrisphaera sp. TA3]|uniref:DUF6797 domain-containing protein n=1 Tax=Tundrisphaera sp. TA3 TaxID=3435775 RepID=UPI003EBAA609